MLNVNFDEVMGYIHYAKGETRFPMCRCNGLYAVIYFHKAEDGEEYADLIDFAVGEDHLKNMLGLSRGYKDSTMDGRVSAIELDMTIPEAQKVGTLFMRAMTKGKWHGTISTL